MFFKQATFALCSLSASVSAREPSKSKLTVGMLFVAPTQFLDTGPIDLISLMSKSYIGGIMAPQPIKAQAIDMDIHYISETGTGTMEMTANARLGMTTSFANAPPLDLLIIPGGSPMHIQTPSERAFVRKIVANKNTASIMSVCTGVTILNQAGVLVNQTATAPYVMLRLFKAGSNSTTWQQKRWVQSTADPRIWTSGVITNGMDMMAAWMRHYFWDRKLAVEFALLSAAAGDRGPDYSQEEMKYWSSLDMSAHDAMHAAGDMKGMAGIDAANMSGAHDMHGMNH